MGQPNLSVELPLTPWSNGTMKIEYVDVPSTHTTTLGRRSQPKHCDNDLAVVFVSGQQDLCASIIIGEVGQAPNKLDRLAVTACTLRLDAKLLRCCNESKGGVRFQGVEKVGVMRTKAEGVAAEPERATMLFQSDPHQARRVEVSEVEFGV
eukprot:scaffold288596_cov32-Tisochrysis_lutea.AAC.2